MIYVHVSRPLLSAMIYATVRKRDGSFKMNLRDSESERQFEDRDSVRERVKNNNKNTENY